MAAPETVKDKRRKRQGKRVLLQLFPMLIGLVGLYFISSWSMMIRLSAPHHDSMPYYIGLALILFSLMLPVILEVNRKYTKHFSFRRVVLGFVALLVALVAAAATLSPAMDMETVRDLEKREWEHLSTQHDDDDEDEEEDDDD